MFGLPPRLSPRNFTSTAFLVASILATDLSSNEQDALGNWFSLVGQILCTMASQQTLLEDEKEQKSQNPSKSS